MTAGRKIIGGGALVVAALGLAACWPTPAPPLSAGEADDRRTQDAQPLAPRPADARSVAGQWDVVSFEGYRPGRISGTRRAAYADFGPEGVSLQLECNASGRPGTVRDGRFVLGGNSSRIQTAIGCGPERGPREVRFFDFFEQSPTVEILGADRLRLRAGGAELVLERPAVRRLAHLPSPAELDGAWRMMEVTRYLPEGGVAGVGLSEIPGRLIIAGDGLHFSACPELGLRFRHASEGRLVKTWGAALASGPLGCAGVSDEADAPLLPSPSQALRLLHADPLVEKTGDGGLLLSTSDYGLLLAPDDR